MPFILLFGFFIVVFLPWFKRRRQAVRDRVEDVRKWTKWQMQGIAIAIVGVIILIDGLAIWTSFPVYETPVYHPEVMFALCGMMPVGTFMIAAGIVAYFYYRDKVKYHGTQETERD